MSRFWLYRFCLSRFRLQLERDSLYIEVHGLCDGEHRISLRSLVLTYYHRVPKRRTDSPPAVMHALAYERTETSTSNGSQIATLRRSLTWTNVKAIVSLVLVRTLKLVGLVPVHLQCHVQHISEQDQFKKNWSTGSVLAQLPNPTNCMWNQTVSLAFWKCYKMWLKDITGGYPNIFSSVLRKSCELPRRTVGGFKPPMASPLLVVHLQ